MSHRRHAEDSYGLVKLYLILLVLIPAQLVIAPVGALGSPATLLGIGCFLWWLAAHAIPSALPPRGRQPARTALFVFTGAILVTYASAVLHYLPADQLSGADRGVLSVVSWTGIALVCMDLLHDRASVERVLRLLVDLTTVLAGVGALQFLTGFDVARLYAIPGLTANYSIATITERDDFRRVQAMASHPIEFGVVLAVVLPLALHYAFASRGQAWPRRAWRWTAVVLIACGAFMSVSRSAILCIAVAFVILLAGWRGSRRALALLCAPVFVVGMRLAIPGLVGTIASLFTGLSSDPSIQGRTDDYSAVGRFIDASPWLGRGFGTFLPHDFFTLDNQYLGSMVETGLVGVTALILLFVIAFFTARGVRRLAPDEDGRDLGQSLAAGVAATAIGFVTFDGLGFPMVTGLTFVLLGCIGALWRLSRAAAGAAEPGVHVPPRRQPSGEPEATSGAAGPAVRAGTRRYATSGPG